MSTLTPLRSTFPLKPLRFIAPLRGQKVDSVPLDEEYLGLEQFESWSGKLSGVELQRPPEGSANVFDKGDVLFGKLRPYLAKGWVAERPGYCTTESLVLAPSPFADSRFLRYCLLTSEVISAIDGSTYGSKMPRADWGFIGGVYLPFPPLANQERIANFLDDKTARIDALIAEKEKLQSALAELRIARVWSAVTGQDSENRQVVPDAAWSSTVPTHWKVTPVGKFARLQRGFDLPDETRTYGSIAVMSGGGVSGWHDVARVKGPGVVTGRYGTIGVLHYVEEDFWPLNTSLFVDDFFGNNPKYACYVLSFLPWDMLGGKSAVPGVNRNDVHPLSVGVPPRAEQDEIVSILDAQFADFDLLSTHVTEHIARLREYRSSLISAAVTGQLDLGVIKDTH